MPRRSCKVWRRHANARSNWHAPGAELWAARWSPLIRRSLGRSGTEECERSDNRISPSLALPLSAGIPCVEAIPAERVTGRHRLMTLLAPFNVNNATISHRFAQFKRKQSHRLATANQVQRDDLTLIDGYDQPTSLQVMTWEVGRGWGGGDMVGLGDGIESGKDGIRREYRGGGGVGGGGGGGEGGVG